MPDCPVHVFYASNLREEQLERIVCSNCRRPFSEHPHEQSKLVKPNTVYGLDFDKLGELPEAGHFRFD